VREEIAKYAAARVDSSSGEILSYNRCVFKSIVRAKEFSLLTGLISTLPQKPTVLDFGCGSGWLCLALSSHGCRVIGVDINSKLVATAKAIVPKANFIVASGENLPLREATMNWIISIATLHHINANLGAREIRRALLRNGVMLAEEPNRLNPLSSLGRKFFPMDVHTSGERPFMPHHLREMLIHSSFRIKKTYYLFFFSFPFARALKILADDIKLHPLLIGLLSAFEDIISKIPIINKLNSSILMIAEKA